MHTAQHPFTYAHLSVPEYIKEFGNKPIGSDTRPRALCPFCKQEMSVHAASTIASSGHFSHLPNSDFCPSKTDNALLYANLHPRRPDPVRGAEIKNRFLENWQCHYQVVNSAVKNLLPHEFINIVKLANQKRIWEYAEIQDYQIPFILLTLTDFEPQYSVKNKTFARKNWFRCWFDNTITEYDDLWIHRAEPPKLWVSWFHHGGAGKPAPRGSDLKGCYSIPVTTEFFNKHSKEVKVAFILERVNEYISNL